MSNRIYLTTTLPYVNAEPHLGFALEAVQADSLARFYRAAGKEVFFNTGTDEHGQKIYETATAAGVPIREYVDRYAGEFRRLKDALNLSNDVFVRTTDPHHVAAAQEMWRRCQARGDIYEKEFAGLYCVGCERFLAVRDLADGKCVVHQRAPHPLREKNWFFRFKKYEGVLLEYLANRQTIAPDWRREEAINFVKEGLEDFSVSREKRRLAWGIPVPGDDSQVMYVWFDALTNYISTLGWPEDRSGQFRKFWQEGETLQFAGKDQVRFQSLMWQAMLISAGIKNTDRVLYHGFITAGGQKMSKSLGNVINPLGLVQEYGTDAVRYFLLRHVHPFEDADVTPEKFKEAYNAHLANGLGNLVSRVMKMAVDNLDGPVGVEDGGRRFSVETRELVNQYRLDVIMEYVWTEIAKLDREIQEKRPWESKDKEVIQNLVKGVFGLGYLLGPFMPQTAERIADVVRRNIMPDPLFIRKA